MTEERPTGGRRWALIGAGLAAVASAGLIAFPLIARLSFVTDEVVYPLVFGLAILMGFGATVTVFNLKRS